MPSPIVTATLQSTALSAASNIVAQIGKSYTAKSAYSFDVLDLVRFAIVNFILTPPNYLWQHYLERTFPASQRQVARSLPLTRKPNRAVEEDEEDMRVPARPRLSITNTFLKWFIDCMTVGALLNTVAFLILMGCLKGQSVNQISSSLRMQTLAIVVDSYKIWPLASIVNFALVPVEKRIVFLSVIGLVWGVYLSLVAARV